ncbi:hypothetical protein [Heliorestis acidaminivorans]|nr:hypothetical protein [Heliorestis acidaminivorans]
MDKAQKKALKNQYKAKMSGDVEAGNELTPVPGDLQCADMPKEK